MAEWQRVVNTTTSKFFRKEEINIMRSRAILALLQNRGRVTFNHSGKDMDWKIRFTENDLTAYRDGGTVGMDRLNRHKTANLDWRGYVMGESLTEKEMRMNRGTEAIIKYYTELMNWMKQDAERNFGKKFFNDGYAAGYEDDYHGIESFMGDSGTPSTLEPVAIQSDNYAGLSTVLGAEGGTWTAPTGRAWPEGNGDSRYDFWSPLLVDYTSAVAAPAGWTATPKTWPNTCVEAIRYGILHTMNNRGKPIDLIQMTTSMYRDILNYHDPLQRIMVRNGADSEMTKVGFPGTFSIDGVNLTTDFDQPAGTAYGFSIQDMELRNMYETIFATKGPTYEDRTASYLYAVINFGNLVFNPRNFVKWKNYTT